MSVRVWVAEYSNAEGKIQDGCGFVPFFFFSFFFFGIERQKKSYSLSQEMKPFSLLLLRPDKGNNGWKIPHAKRDRMTYSPSDLPCSSLLMCFFGKKNERVFGDRINSEKYEEGRRKNNIQKVMLRQ